MLVNALRISKSFDEFSNEFLLDVYTKGPERLKIAVTDLCEDELTVFPFKDKWSIKEIAFHILDSELVGSIRQLLEIYADHCERHIDQISARRRLFGKPSDQPIILSKRLY